MATYNPLLGQEEYPRGSFLRPIPKVPKPRPDEALVFYRTGTPSYVVLNAGDHLISAEASRGGFISIYRVDMSPHWVSFDCQLPCSQDIFYFDAQIQMRCAVLNAALIVQEKVTDVRALLEDPMITAMRMVSRQFEVRDSAGAESKILELLRTNSFHRAIGISEISVIVSLDSASRAHLERLAQIEKDKEIARATQAYDDLRRDYLVKLLARDDRKLIAQRLMEHPEDLVSVMAMLRERRQDQRNYMMEMLQFMEKVDAIDESDLSEAARQLVYAYIASGPTDISAFGVPPEMRQITASNDVDQTEPIDRDD